MSDIETSRRGHELFDYVRGVSYDKRDARERPFDGCVGVLRAGNITDAGLELSDLVYVPGECASPTQRLRRGDVVIAMSSGSASVVGKAAAVAEDRPDLAFGAFCGVARPRNDGDAAWLRHYFASPEYRSTVRDAAMGVNINNLRSSVLLELEIPTPNLDEQRRIVAKLDALRARSRRAKDALDAVPALLDRLRQSILAAAFRGDLTADWREQNPDVEPAAQLLKRIRIERRKRWEEAELAKLIAKGKPPKDGRWKEKYVEPEPVDDTDLPELPDGWCWTVADELVTADIVYGIVQPGPEVPDGIPFVRAQDMEDGRVHVQQLGRTSASVARRHANATLHEGDVLLGIIRAMKVAIVPAVLDGGCIVRGIARLRPHPLVTSSYLASWLDSPLAQGWLRARHRGMDMPVVNVGDVRRLPVPLCPQTEQSALESRMRAALERWRGLREHVAPVLDALDLADRSVLAAAFRGELLDRQSDTTTSVSRHAR